MEIILHDGAKPEKLGLLMAGVEEEPVAIT